MLPVLDNRVPRPSVVSMIKRCVYLSIYLSKDLHVSHRVMFGPTKVQDINVLNKKVLTA